MIYLKIIVANTFKDKLIGLMGKKNINYGLLIKNCKSIHTYFMKENIDVLLLDQENRILFINRDVKKNKVLIYHTKKKSNILELPSNSSINLKVNDIIDLNKFNP